MVHFESSRETNNQPKPKGEGNSNMKTQKLSSKQIEALNALVDGKHVDGRALAGLRRAGALDSNNCLTTMGDKARNDGNLAAVIVDNAAKAQTKQTKAAKAPKAPKAAKIMPLCGCGCGKPTKGGKFRMGHDARLASLIMKASNATYAQAKDIVHLVTSDKDGGKFAIDYAVNQYEARA